MRWLLILVLLCSCAPMPGPNLYEGMESKTDLKDVEITYHDGFIETQEFCFKNLDIKTKVLLCVLNLCWAPACAHITFDNGKVKTCDVYYSLDIFLNHELKHCEGYDDLLY